MTDDNLFDNTETVTTETTETNDIANPLEELVGEGKKFKTAEDLAKSKLESDKFIKQLQSELEGIRTDLNDRLSMEEYLAKLDQKMQAPTKPTAEDSSQTRTETGDPSGLSIEQIEALIEQRVSEREAKSRVDQNVQKVQSMGQQAFGPDYKKVFQTKANQLGIDTDILNKMAEQNPEGFLNIMGVSEAITTKQKSDTNKAIFGGASSEVNTEAKARTSSSGQPRMSDFTKMRKENPKEYWSPAVQNQMMKYTAEYGSDFLDN